MNLVLLAVIKVNMTASGRVEVNLCRLLNRCEAMASGNDCQDWRLEKVIWNCICCNFVIMYSINT